jgi:hypothetical protein
MKVRPETNQPLNRIQAAALMGCSPTVIANWVRQGVLHKEGKYIMSETLYEFSQRRDKYLKVYGSKRWLKALKRGELE